MTAAQKHGNYLAAGISLTNREKFKVTCFDELIFPTLGQAYPLLMMKTFKQKYLLFEERTEQRGMPVLTPTRTAVMVRCKEHIGKGLACRSSFSIGTKLGQHCENNALTILKTAPRQETPAHQWAPMLWAAFQQCWQTYTDPPTVSLTQGLSSHCPCDKWRDWMRQLGSNRWGACGPGTKLCCSAQGHSLGLISIMLSPPKLTSHSSATIQHRSLRGTMCSQSQPVWALSFSRPLSLAHDTQKLMSSGVYTQTVNKAAMRCPSTGNHGRPILIKWQLWPCPGKARNSQRISKAYSLSAMREQHTWPSPDLGSWRARWVSPAWRTGVCPGQSVPLRGKVGSAAEGSPGRHPWGTLEQRPDKEW